MGRTHEYRIGHPLCRGPVCQLCYEMKVVPAQSKVESGERRIQSPCGAWLYITDSGEDYMTSNPKDLIFNMLTLGCRALQDICEVEMREFVAPEWCESQEE